MKKEKEKAERGTIFLKPRLWREIEALAHANGREPAEELRACLIIGLRIAQKQLREAYGPEVALMPTAEEKDLLKEEN